MIKFKEYTDKLDYLSSSSTQFLEESAGLILVAVMYIQDLLES